MARVLIVDDAAFMRMMLRRILTESGHEVVGEAGDGETALELYDRLAPDVTVLDVTMPGRSGVEVLRDLLAAHPRARVVMCSGQGQQAEVVESMKLGAREFLVKPIEADAVQVAITKALDGAG